MSRSVSLVMIPVFIAAPGADEALRQGLTLLWCCMALYLLWKLAVGILGGLRRKGSITGARAKTQSGPVDVVQWVLPRASSSPSQGDAMRHLPEYSARLIAE